jgi:cytochrome c oxidase subunit 3
MKIGTAEIIDKVDEEKRRRGGLITGSGSPNGGGGNNGGGGGDGPDGEPPNLKQRFNSEKLRVLTFFLLLAIMMTFGGLIAAYVVIATNGVAEWQPFNLPVQVWISTCLILASSVTYHFGQQAVENNIHSAAKKWLIATTGLGAAFISSQIMAWIALTNRGLYMSGNPYAGFFYILTAVHAIHVIGGISALGSVLLRSWAPTTDPERIKRRSAIAKVVGWYWHFMGGLWIVLFVLLGFWK